MQVRRPFLLAIEPTGQLTQGRRLLEVCVSILRTVGALTLARLKNTAAPTWNFILLKSSPFHLPREFSVVYIYAVYISRDGNANALVWLPQPEPILVK